MIISFEGGSKLQRALVEDIILSAKRNLIPRLRTLDLNVVIRKFKGNEKEISGWCLNEQEGRKNPRQFTLELNTFQCKDSFIRTVLHEMVHVKQYAYNELDRRGGVQKWKNVDYSDCNYADMPWEEEAYELELELYDMYMLEALK